jgi:hypothetical protein
MLEMKLIIQNALQVLLCLTVFLSPENPSLFQKMSPKYFANFCCRCDRDQIQVSREFELRLKNNKCSTEKCFN